MRNLFLITIIIVSHATLATDQIPEFGSINWGVSYDEVMAVAGEPTHTVDQIGNVLGASIIYHGGRFASVPLELTVYEFAPGCVLSTGQAHTCRFSRGKYAFKVPTGKSGGTLQSAARKQFEEVETYLSRRYGPGEKIRGNDYYMERRLDYVTIRHALTFGESGNSHNLWYVGPTTETQFENYRIARNEGASSSGGLTRHAPEAEVETLQRSILEGHDPSTTLDATAAGPQ